MRISPPVLLAMTCLAACGESASIDPAIPAQLTGVFVSDARPNRGSSSLPNAGSLRAGDDDVAYLSIAPKSLSSAIKVEISNRTKSLPPSLIALVDGGLDPFPVAADAGDTLDLNVWHSDGSQQPILVKVPAKRPPSIVRTSPSKGRTDVALNVVITVIFTEPVDSQTVNSSTVRLLRNGAQVGGKVVLEDNLWTADFIPDIPLDESASYELVVTQAVRDLDGEVLDSAFTSTFTTGECDPAFDASACASPTGGTVITGSVIDRTGGGSKVVSGAIVDAWSQMSDGTGARVSAVRSDANGAYAIAVPTGSTVQLHAFVPGFDQPCGVAAGASPGSAKADIELVATGSPRPDAAISQPRMSGHALEPAPDPSRDNQLLLLVPVAGVRLFLEAPQGFLAASTTTDERGFYSLCRLPDFDQIVLSATKAGFAPYEKLLSIRGLADVPFDLTLSH